MSFVQIPIKVVLFCMQNQPILEIRIRDHSQTCFDTTNLMAISKLTSEFSLKIMFFEVSTIVLFCVKLQCFDIEALF